MSSVVINRKNVSHTHNVETTLSVNQNEIELYDVIMPWKYGDEDPAVTPDDILNVLKEAEGDITLRINSRGGEVGSALPIYNRLKSYEGGKKTAIVDGYAFSSAGWIPMACDERQIATGGIFMNHNPMMVSEITSLKDIEAVKSEWEAHHKSIVDIFEEATDISRQNIIDMMDKETYLSAEDAVNAGFFHSMHTNKAKLEALNYVSPNTLPEEFAGSIPPAPSVADVSGLKARRSRM